MAWRPRDAEGTPLAVAALVLWILTAGAGLTLLIAGRAGRRQGADAPERPMPVYTGGVQRTDDGRPPPIPKPTVHAAPGEHPLLEFSHPAIGILGIGCWFIFLGTHNRVLAWAAFGILVATIAAGLSWLASTTAARRRSKGPRATFPPQLILAHGTAAAITLTLVVLTAVSASHG